MSEHIATRARGRLPLYFQIEIVLRKRIRSGHYPAGSGFPTEDQLCREFSVSRGTIRAALDALHRDGLIMRQASWGGPGAGAPSSRDTSPARGRFGSVARSRS